MRSLAFGFVMLALIGVGCVDQLSGLPTLDEVSLSVCIQTCNEIRKDAQEEERDFHRENVRACAGDRDCLNAEAERHTEAMREINEESQECKRICRHDQGGGHSEG